MRKKLSFLLVGILALSLNTISAMETQKDNVISNKFFSIVIPKETPGKYITKKQKNGIFIYDKLSKKEGFGGFAFGIKPYKLPSEHAMCPGCRKIGELIDKNKTIYDMVLIQPTDVQFNYTKPIPKSYEFLYSLADNVEIKSSKRAKYVKNQGMKGEDLYKDILAKHLKAVKEKWDSIKLEEENMSYMYNVIAQSNKNPLNKIGYKYYDVNGDGIDELFIGEIAKGSFKGVAYDIYTMTDRKPVHVISGGARDRYFACDGTFVCREYSSGAQESGMLVYNLVENSTELFPQVGFKYDGYENKKNPWFISYDFEKDEWDNVSKEKYDERKKVFNKYERFDYIPLSTLK